MGRSSVGRARGARDGLTTADVVVLSLLTERAMHGYDLISEYERQEVVDWASVSKAQVYYALQKLERLGLIETAPDAEGVRERTVFAPTEQGRIALAGDLGHTDWAKGRTANPFATWLGLSIHAGRDVIAPMIAARRQFLLEELAREKASLNFLMTLDSERARAGRLIVDLVIRTLEAEMNWLESLHGQSDLPND